MKINTYHFPSSGDIPGFNCTSVRYYDLGAYTASIRDRISFLFVITSYIQILRTYRFVEYITELYPRLDRRAMRNNHLG